MSKKEERAFNIDPYLVSTFRLFYPNTFNLIIEIVNDLISDFNLELYCNIKENRNSKLVEEYIQNHCALIIYYKLSKDDRYKSNIKRFEISKTNGKSSINLKELHKEYLMLDIESYFQFTKLFSVLLSSERNQKNLMHKLKIYKEYKPAGNKYEEGHRLIYNSIPFIQDKLVEEYSGIKKGKSDLLATVKKTIKFLEKEKSIPPYKYDPDKVYDSYLKSDYFRQHKAEKRIKTLRNSNKAKN